MCDSDSSVTPTSDFMADSVNGRRKQENRRMSKQQAKTQKQLARSRAQEYEALGKLGFPKNEIDLTSEPIGKSKCKYGAKCYQTSLYHMKHFSHPKHEEMTETLSQEVQRLPLIETKDDRDAIVDDDASLSVGEESEEESEYLEDETSEGGSASPGNGSASQENKTSEACFLDSSSNDMDMATKLSMEFRAEGLHNELRKLCAAIKKARRVLEEVKAAQLVVREETRQILAMRNQFKERTSKKTSKRSSKSSFKEQTSTKKSKKTSQSTSKLTQQTLTQQNAKVFGPHAKRQRDTKANDSSSSSGEDTWEFDLSHYLTLP